MIRKTKMKTDGRSERRRIVRRVLEKRALQRAHALMVKGQADERFTDERGLRQRDGFLE